MFVENNADMAQEQITTFHIGEFELRVTYNEELIDEPQPFGQPDKVMKVKTPTSIEIRPNNSHTDLPFQEIIWAYDLDAQYGGNIADRINDKLYESTND